MSGPWYEEQEMSHQAAREDIYNHFKIPKTEMEKHPNKDAVLKRIIQEVIPNTLDMCSIRGYHTFQRPEFIEKVDTQLKRANKPTKSAATTTRHE